MSQTVAHKYRYYVHFQTLVEIDHTLRVQGHHVVEKVETCAEEVAEYLSDHSNWWTPIFPAVPGCSSLEVDPQYFNTSGTFWDCDNQMDKGTSIYFPKIYAEILISIIRISCAHIK